LRKVNAGTTSKTEQQLTEAAPAPTTPAKKPKQTAEKKSDKKEAAKTAVKGPADKSAN